MRTTYLVYKQVNGLQQLMSATQKEWDTILKENKGLPAEKRRYFIADSFEDGNELDCIYIEVSAAEHRAWNSKHTVSMRNSKLGARHTILSLDVGVPDAEIQSLHECVPADFDLEGLVIDHVLIEELKAALREWKPWAEEMLELYLSGKNRSCSTELSEKYQLSDRTIRKRKKAFKEFVLDFLKNKFRFRR